MQILCSPSPLTGREIQAWVLPAVLFARFEAFFADGPRERKFLLTGPLELLRKALLVGAADYLADPWTWEELHLRGLKALGALRLEMAWGPLWLEGNILTDRLQRVELTVSEKILAQTIFSEQGRPVSRERLSHTLGKPVKSPRHVDVHISWLRKKLQLLAPESHKNDDPVPNARGLGYYWQQ